MITLPMVSGEAIASFYNFKLILCIYLFSLILEGLETMLYAILGEIHPA